MEKSEDSKKHVFLRELLLLIIKLLTIALMIFLLFKFVLLIYIPKDDQMYPMFQRGDVTVAYRLDKNYEEGEVVTYTHDDTKNIGRVLALEGSTVDISENGELIINGGIKQEEVFFDTKLPKENSNIEFPYTVPSGCYFILNDYREKTNDSREYGAIPKEDITGSVFITIRRKKTS